MIWQNFIWYLMEFKWRELFSHSLWFFLALSPSWYHNSCTPVLHLMTWYWPKREHFAWYFMITSALCERWKHRWKIMKRVTDFDLTPACQKILCICIFLLKTGQLACASETCLVFTLQGYRNMSFAQLFLIHQTLKLGTFLGTYFAGTSAVTRNIGHPVTLS